MAAFKVADGYVEIHARVNERAVRRAAEQAGDDAGNRFTRSMGAATAQGAGVVANRAGNVFADRFGVSAARRMRRSGSRAGDSFLGSFGDTVATGFGRMLSRSLNLTGVGVLAIVQAAAAIAAVLLPAIGAALAAGGGLALVIAGAIASIATSERVRSSGRGLGETIVAGISDAAERSGLNDAMVRVFASFERTWREIQPDVQRTFTTLVPLVEDLSDAFGDFVARMAPGLADFAERVSPFLDVFADWLATELPDDILRSFDTLLSIDPRALGDLLSAVSGLLPLVASLTAAFERMGGSRVLVAVVNGLTMFMDIVRAIPGPVLWAIGAVTNPFIALAGLVLALGEGMKWLSGVIRDFVDGFARTIAPAQGFLTALSGLQNPIGTVARGLLGLGGESRALKVDLEGTTGATDRLGEANSDLIPQVDATKAAIDREKAALDELYNSLFETEQQLLDTRAAEREFERAIDDATDAVRENGANLDINTEAGRKNQAALDNLASSALKVSERQLEAGASAEDMRSHMERAREKFIQTAVQMGLTRGEAKALADSFGLIPDEVETKAELRDQATAKIRSLEKRLTQLDGRVSTVTVIEKTVHRVETDFRNSNRRPGGSFRFGGVRFAQDGLVRLSGAHLFPAGPTIFGFAEPGTGGEAFVARNAPRQRSLDILDVAARWHKAVVLPLERMAVTAGGAPAAAPVPPPRPTAAAATIANHYHFHEGAIQVDASRLHSVQDLVRLVQEIHTTARQFAGASVESTLR